jgi:uncharacterized protein YerC
MTLKDVSAIQEMLEAGVSYYEIAEATGFSEVTIHGMHLVLKKHGKEYRQVSAVRTCGLTVQKRNREARSRPEKVAVETLGI